jgi:Asp-tRNA(Asn)/Glu-tRNA(Gln) amidotransferase B subunit
MTIDTILKSLAQGDMRSTGASDAVARTLAQDPKLFSTVFRAVASDDTGLAMRSADAVEKASRQNSNLLGPHKQKLLELAETATQQEVQWHVAQMLERIALSPIQQRTVFAALERMHTKSVSRIVKSSTLQALVRIAAGDPQLERRALRLLDDAATSAILSLRARARKLSKEFAERRGGR